MDDTPVSVELRCTYHLHGVLLLPRVTSGSAADDTDPAVIEVRCMHCRRKAGYTVTHRWRARDAVRLPDRREANAA